MGESFLHLTADDQADKHVRCAILQGRRARGNEK
jgi:hypothetical protein